MKNIISTSILTLVLTSTLLYSQEFKYKAGVENVETEEFYKIHISPEITSKLKSDFSDIRLLDSANVEIPYLLYTEKIISEKELFVEYEIVELEHLKSRNYTRIVIRNKNKSEINNIVLRIKNADVRKHLKLNASYDNKNWYVLKDNYYYNSINNYENTSEIRVLNFPLSDYEYYELLIGDCFDKPINITNAGYYDLVKEKGKYTELQDIFFTSYDTLKETTIIIPNNGYYINKISFDIDTPKYYLREAEIFLRRTELYNNRKETYHDNIAYFNLISNSSNTFSLNGLNADTIYIRIKNNDNLPLNINKIRLFELNKYITSELNPTQKYSLYFSDEKADKAIYDLKYFTDSIPEGLQIIKVNKVQKLSIKSDGKESNNLNMKSYWLWIIISVVAIILFYMSFKMIKDLKK